MLHELRVSMESLATTVAELYHASVPPEARIVEFRVDGDAYRCAKTNAQKLIRYMDDDVSARMPVDLEEAWVAALKLLGWPYGRACAEQLTYRYGYAPVELPDMTRAHDVSKVSALMSETAQAMLALTPLVDDGRIDSDDDRQQLRSGLRELDDVIASALALKLQIAAALGEVG